MQKKPLFCRLLQASEFLRIWRTVSVQKSSPHRRALRGRSQQNLNLSEALRKHMGPAGNSFKIINEKRTFQFVTVKRSELYSNHLRSVVFQLFKSSEMRVRHHPWEIITLIGGRSLFVCVLYRCWRKLKPLVPAWFPIEKESSWSKKKFFFYSTCMQGTAVIPHCCGFQSNYYQLPLPLLRFFLF